MKKIQDINICRPENTFKIYWVFFISLAVHEDTIRAACTEQTEVAILDLQYGETLDYLLLKVNTAINV